MRVKYGVFIEPTGALRDSVLMNKRTLQRAFPNAAYVGHPPHCTVIFGECVSPEHWVDGLRTTLKTNRGFEVETNAWQDFPADPLTGGHTLAYRILKSPQLAALQLRVARFLAPHMRPSESPHPLAETEPFASSLRHYHSPFVGDHWIPHFTIGSPRADADDPVLNAIRSTSPLHQFTLREVTIYRVDQDCHEVVDRIPLN